jgi:hypothetical protein
LLSADAGRNTIFGYYPSVKKSGFDLGARSNFITSLPSDNERYVWNDSAQNAQKERWFRPSDVTIGTDGAIYVADWYDPVGRWPPNERHDLAMEEFTALLRKTKAGCAKD